MANKSDFEKKVEETKKQYVGKRVRFVANHPHFGRSGEIIDLKRTLVGWMFEVKLDDYLGHAMFNSPLQITWI